MKRRAVANSGQIVANYTSPEWALEGGRCVFPVMAQFFLTAHDCTIITALSGESAVTALSSRKLACSPKGEALLNASATKALLITLPSETIPYTEFLRRLQSPEETARMAEEITKRWLSREVSRLQRSMKDCDRALAFADGVLAIQKQLLRYDPKYGNSLKKFICGSAGNRMLDEARTRSVLKRSDIRFVKAFKQAVVEAKASGSSTEPVALAKEMGIRPALLVQHQRRLALRGIALGTSFDTALPTRDRRAHQERCSQDCDPSEVLCANERRAIIGSLLSQALDLLPVHLRYLVEFSILKDATLSDAAAAIDEISQRSLPSLSIDRQIGLELLRTILHDLGSGIPAVADACPAPTPGTHISGRCIASLGLRRLRSLVKSNPELPIRTDILGHFADTPAYFAEFFRTEDSALSRYRKKLLALGGVACHELSTRSFKLFGQWVEHECQRIDLLKSDSIVALALGCHRSRVKSGGETSENGLSETDRLLRRCLQFRFYERFWTPGSQVARWSRLHPLLRPSIVGAEVAELNRMAALKERFSTLDSITVASLGGGYATLFGVKSSSQVIDARRAAIAQGICSFDIPLGHSLPVDRLSAYFDERVVGKEKARENFEIWVRHNWRSLDQVKPSRAIATFLGVEDTETAICRELIKRKLIDPLITKDAKLSYGEGRLGRHFREDIVGSEIVRKNVMRYFKFHVPTIDVLERAFQPLQTLGRLTGVGNSSTRLARWAIEHAGLPAAMPKGHPLTKGHYLSFFVCKEVVGRKKALENLRKWVQENVKDLHGTRQYRKALLTVMNQLRDPKSPKLESQLDLARDLVRREWMPATPPPAFEFNGPKSRCFYNDPIVRSFAV